jgi:tryptophan-rich sensory protein
VTARSRGADALGLGASLLVSYTAAALGAWASADAPTFYAQLAQPSWAPPASLFGPVWSTLFTMMGVAAWLVWRAPGRRTAALALFGVQLAVNALWSWLFFAWRLGAAATVEVVLLVALVAATILAFRRHSRLAAALLVPYFLWVGFAAVLTFVLWRGNPTLL